jgi:transcriptional antiterminator RfaH
MRWYAVHTKPRQETVAQAALDREGVQTFLPRLRRKKIVRRKYQWVTGPLFPGYLFACFDFALRGRLVRYANGVTNIVSFGGKPAVVDDTIIRTIQDHCDGDTVTLQPVAYQPGDEVKIQEGPLAGLRGIFERDMRDSERVVILLQTMGQVARVVVSKEQIEKL